MENEIWKDVVGYEGLYRVSNMGRVKSLDRYIISKGSAKKQKEKILADRFLSKGYLGVVLYENGKSKSFKSHRLVGLSFIPNPENKPQINHINEIKGDNRVENLEWSTARENMNHGSRPTPVKQYSLNNKFIKKWKSMSDAEYFGFNHSHISSCCKGKRKTHAGFKWEYA